MPHSAYQGILILCLVLGLANCYSNSYDFENHKYCDDLSPYFGDINLDQILGVWRGVEMIPHTKGEYKIDYSRDCFYVTIKEVDTLQQRFTSTPYPPLPNSPYVNRELMYPERPRQRYLVLEWHEGMKIDEYHIKVNTSHNGFWITDVPDGYVENMYRFFGGIIQVLKVANNHLVLNFCMRLPHSQLYSVVMTRSENQLSPEDLSYIHNIFSLKQLSTSTLKRVCDNSATSISVSILALGTVIILIWRSGH